MQHHRFKSIVVITFIPIAVNQFLWIIDWKIVHLTPEAGGCAGRKQVDFKSNIIIIMNL